MFLHCTRFPMDEQDIIKATKGGVISRVECFGIAAVLNIDAKALRAELEYFNDLNIFLYYPSVLPAVVFCNPLVYFRAGCA